MKPLRVALSVVVANFAAGVASADALPPDLKACIEEHAAGVEKVQEPLGESVDFLVSKRCAIPLAAFVRAQYEAESAKQNDARKRKCDELAKADPKKSDMCDVYDLSGAYMGSWVIYSGQGPAPAEATALAAQLILNLRTQRLEAKPQ